MLGQRGRANSPFSSTSGAQCRRVVSFMFIGPLWFIRAGRRCGVHMFVLFEDEEEGEEVGRRASIAIFRNAGWL